MLKCALLMVLMAGFSFFYFKDLVEKVMILRKSIERLRNCEVAVQSPILAEKLTCYAGILAAEGSLTTAMTYLPENSDQVRSSFYSTLESTHSSVIVVFKIFFVCFSSPSSAWDQNAERATVPRADRSFAEQGGWGHTEDCDCCSDSCSKGSSYGTKYFVETSPFKLLIKVELC